MPDNVFDDGFTPEKNGSFCKQNILVKTGYVLKANRALPNLT